MFIDKNVIIIGFDSKNLEFECDLAIQNIIKAKKEPFKKIFIQIPKNFLNHFYKKTNKNDLKPIGIHDNDSIITLEY